VSWPRVCELDSPVFLFLQQKGLETDARLLILFYLIFFVVASSALNHLCWDYTLVSEGVSPTKSVEKGFGVVTTWEMDSLVVGW